MISETKQRGGNGTTVSEATRPRRTVYVVLPAYNEVASIGALLDQIADTLDEANLQHHVVVVDDGSSDGTSDEVGRHSGRLPLSLVRHERNQGLGATIRDGLLAAAKLARDDDVIISMDADGTHGPGFILQMVRMIVEGYDVVIASRYRDGSRVLGVPAIRRFMSAASSLLFQVVLPIPGVRDFTCGFRAYRGRVIQKAIAEFGDRFVDQDGFQCMVDILLKLRKMDVIFCEVPFLLRYDQKAGASKMKVAQTAVSTLRLMVRRRLEG